MPTYAIGYGNRVGPNDEGFWEWWEVLENGDPICRCDFEEDAKRIVAALQKAAEAK